MRSAQLQRQRTIIISTNKFHESAVKLKQKKTSKNRDSMERISASIELYVQIHLSYNAAVQHNAIFEE